MTFDNLQRDIKEHLLINNKFDDELIIRAAADCLAGSNNNEYGFVINRHTTIYDLDQDQLEIFYKIFKSAFQSALRYERERMANVLRENYEDEVEDFGIEKYSMTRNKYFK